MSQELIIDIIRNGVLTILAVSAPPLLLGLVVGLLVSVFQAVTSIQEPTMAFVPKIVAVLFSLIIFGYFMLSTLYEYVNSLLGSIPNIIQGLN
ncbi:MAG: flagellar biosynthesis protein FliQ [Defluviitaleaceae bacterium]|nr:flagellar biosynthesis protein FliQ [Defluviitaleaceae bacterium]